MLQIKDKIKNFSKFIVWHQRGNNLFDLFTAFFFKATFIWIFIDLVDRWFGWRAPPESIPILLIILPFVYTFVGWLDIRHLGWYTYQEKYVSGEINTYHQENYNEIFQKLNNIRNTTEETKRKLNKLIENNEQKL